MKTQYTSGMSASLPLRPEELHPDVWRASQLAHSSVRCLDTGHPTLSGQLGGKGWPMSSLIELLVQQAGIGELRLVAPALVKVAHRRIILIQPPHAPQTIALAALGLEPSQVIWVKSKTTSEALWAAEQVLRSGSCGAVVFWLTHVKAESLRRLHLAAQAGETLFFVLRPLSAAQDSSPAPLRLSLRPAANGLEVGFLKRRGPQRDEPLFIPLHTSGAIVRTAVPQRALEPAEAVLSPPPKQLRDIVF